MDTAAISERPAGLWGVAEPNWVMLEVRCACGETLKVPTARIGKPLSCASCKTALRVVAPGFRVGPDDPSGLLVIRTGPHRGGEQIFLAGDLPIQIGKLPGSDIRLQGNLVSRSHCRLTRADTGWQLEDEGSTNGVYVNGLRVRHSSLQHGDRLRVGDYRMKFLDPSQATATAVPVPAEEAPKPGYAKGTAPPAKRAAPPKKKPPVPPPPPPAEEEPIYAEAVEVPDDEWAALAGGGDKVVPVADLEPTAEATAIDSSGTYFPGHEANAPVAAGTGARRGFWADIGWTFLLFTEPGNLIMVGIIWVLFVIKPFLGLAGCLGVVCQLILLGWLCSYWFKVILDAASGEDDLPGLSLTEGWAEDIVFPFFKFLGAWIVAAIPAGIVGAILIFVMGIDPDDVFADSAPVAIAMAAVLALVWPIIVLVVAIGGITAVIRVDLIAATVARTIVPYLAVCLLVAGAVALEWSAPLVAAKATGSAPTAFSVGGALAALLQAYFGIVSVRIVGLYYHHFKQRFAWDWG